MWQFSIQKKKKKKKTWPQELKLKTRLMKVDRRDGNIEVKWPHYSQAVIPGHQGLQRSTTTIFNGTCSVYECE